MSQRPKFLDKTYHLEMTGEQLLRLFELSYRFEGNHSLTQNTDGHARPGDRFYDQICGILKGEFKNKDEFDLRERLLFMFSKMKYGQYIP